MPIDKPVDWTSFDVVNKIRRMTGIRKVGHAGTLDPFATGLLLICLGPATKRSSELMNLPKTYVAEIALGTETDTMDVTGKVIAEKVVPPFGAAELSPVLAQFIGPIKQEIPAYSAARFKGKRLYALARDGKAVPQLFKQVDVHEIELRGFTADSISIRVLCGCGTYIRTLGRDIARALGTAGHVRTLVRTQVGDYRLEDAYTIDALQAQINATESSGG